MLNKFQKIKGKIKKTYFKNHYDYGKEIHTAEETNLKIKEMILGEEPFMISRIGSVELECLVDREFNKEYKEETKIKMRRNAGFFPTDGNSLEKFNDIFLNALASVDLLGVWYNEREDFICRKYCKSAGLAHLKDLEPYYHEEAWSMALEGKKVLVIHPFKDSIDNQYTKKREKIFEDKNVLPPFELITLKAVQTVSGNNAGFDTWFDALSSMCREIDSIEFDIAIIGAGAYGLPLAAYIKSLEKKAIHLGGATQILFGIKGARWEKHPVISGFFNESWIKPAKNEQPASFKNVEKGCYW